VLKFFSRIRAVTREETFLGELPVFSSTMSAIRDELSYVLLVRRFRDAKPLHDFHRRSMSAEPALRLAMNSGVRTKPQSVCVALLPNQVIAMAPFPLNFPMLRIRPPFLHIFAAARAPSLETRCANRRFALRREFRWNRFPPSAHGSSSHRISLTHFTHASEAAYRFFTIRISVASEVSAFFFPALPRLAVVRILWKNAGSNTTTAPYHN
jgi:hypothetical protein